MANETLVMAKKYLEEALWDGVEQNDVEKVRTVIMVSISVTKLSNVNIEFIALTFNLKVKKAFQPK